jgi:hypothetical protein
MVTSANYLPRFIHLSTPQQTGCGSSGRIFPICLPSPSFLHLYLEYKQPKRPQSTVCISLLDKLAELAVDGGGGGGGGGGGSSHRTMQQANDRVIPRSVVRRNRDGVSIANTAVCRSAINAEKIGFFYIQLLFFVGFLVSI